MTTEETSVNYLVEGSTEGTEVMVVVISIK